MTPQRRLQTVERQFASLGSFSKATASHLEGRSFGERSRWGLDKTEIGQIDADTGERE
jgi:hypothetical protein